MMEIAASSFAMDRGLRSRLQNLARHILDEQERRQRYFPRDLFDDLPWRILLTLYASETGRLSSDSLSNCLVAKPATVCRWIDYLARDELATRHLDPSDKSRPVVELAPKGVGLLELYLGDRLERGEYRTGPHERPARSRRSEMPVEVLVLVTAALSAGLTYVAMSLGAATSVFAWN